MASSPDPPVPDPALYEFLRLCLRSRHDPGALDVARTQSAQSGFDWGIACRLAEAEGVAAMLYHTLRRQKMLPAAAAQSLRRAYDGNALRNTYLLHHLETALHRLAEDGREAVLLKGAALCRTVYGRRGGVRPMGDVDLLVRPGDVPAIVAALASLGYEPEDAEPRPGVQLAYENELQLQRPGLIPVFLGLHWSLFDSPYYQQRLNLDWFWLTVRPVPVGAAAALILGPEAQILHLCGHLALHHGGAAERRLLWVHDVAEVLALYQDQIDWEEPLSQTQVCDLVLPVQQVFGQVVEEWGSPVPGDALERLRALTPTPAEAQVFAQLTSGHRPVAHRFWSDLTGLPTWRGRLAYASIHLFPTRAYMQHHYHIPHPLLAPLYYPYRWLVGLCSGLRRPAPTPRRD